MLPVPPLHGVGRIEERELLARLVFGQQVRRCDRQQAHRLVHLPVRVQQGHRGLDQRAGGVGRPLERHLPRAVAELRVADAELHGLAHHPAAAQAAADIVAQRGQAHAAFVLAEQVVRKGHAVAHAFDLALLVKRAHRLVVLAAGVAQQGIAHFAENPMHKRGVARGELADGVHAQPGEPVRRALADIEQRVHRHRPDLVPVVFAREHGRAVRLFVVAAQLGERAVERHTDRDRQPDLLAHPSAQLVRDLLARAEQVHRAGDIQKGLVNAERINQIGVLQIQLVALARIFDVFRAVRCDQPQVGALAPGLPDGFGGLHAERLGFFVFRQDDAVAALRVAADRGGTVRKIGVEQGLDRSVKRVAVAVQDRAFHGIPSNRTFVSVIIA